MSDGGKIKSANLLRGLNTFSARKVSEFSVEAEYFLPQEKVSGFSVETEYFLPQEKVSEFREGVWGKAPTWQSPNIQKGRLRRWVVLFG